MTRYEKPSKHGEAYGTAAVLSGGVASAGGSAWALGRRQRRDAVASGAANRNFAVIRRAGLDMRQEADGALATSQRAAQVADRRERLAGRTRARLTPIKGAKGEKYTESGRKGIYPTSRLKAIDAAVAAGRKTSDQQANRFTRLASDSRASLKQAGRMERDFHAAAGSFKQAKKIVRGGRAATLAGVAGTVGFAAAAELGRGKQPKVKKTPLKQVAASNVVDMNRYRQMHGTRDDRGATLIDAQGYKKQVPSANAWLKNHGGQK